MRILLKQEKMEVAVTSAEPYANRLHFSPRQHLTTQFLQAGRSSWRPTNSVEALRNFTLTFSGIISCKETVTRDNNESAFWNKSIFYNNNAVLPLRFWHRYVTTLRSDPFQKPAKSLGEHCKPAWWGLYRNHKLPKFIIVHFQSQKERFWRQKEITWTYN